MSIAGKRALITGIQGFTGRYMAAELAAQGCEVVGLGSQPSSEANYHQADLTDLVGLSKLLADIQPDIVVHLAALAFVGHGAAEAG
jgi:nucleoside-diphosphate-sugar epimerase